MCGDSMEISFLYVLCEGSNLVPLHGVPPKVEVEVSCSENSSNSMAY